MDREIKIAQGQETRKCKDCGRVGCWTETTDDSDYIQCKCGNEILKKEKPEIQVEESQNNNRINSEVKK